jgi:iron complex transport system substrate-binding protein
MGNRPSTLVTRANCFTKATIGLLVGLVAGSTGAATPGEAALLSNNPTQGCVDAYDPSVDYFPDKATITHARAFTLEYFKQYKVLTVLEPWPDARDSFRYVLVQCGTPAPEPISGAHVIQVPVDTIATLSSTHLPHLILLGALDRLVALGDFKTVNSPSVRRKIDASELVEIGRSATVNIEIVLELALDLVTVVGHDQPQYNTHPFLQQAGINVAINAEYLEPTLLGRSEWLKFTAAFFNKDGLAQRRFDEIVDRYQAYAALTRDLPAAEKPTVFGGSLHRDTWYVAGGRSYIAQLLEAAGGAYLWADDTRRGSVPLSFEAMFDRAVDARFWFLSGLHWFTRADLLAANERYDAFRAFRESRVYNNNRRLNEHGGNDYWETAIVEPHILLADVIKILHPERLPDHQLQYHRHLP